MATATTAAMIVHYLVFPPADDIPPEDFAARRRRADRDVHRETTAQLLSEMQTAGNASKTVVSYCRKHLPSAPPQCFRPAALFSK